MITFSVLAFSAIFYVGVLAIAGAGEALGRRSAFCRNIAGPGLAFLLISVLATVMTAAAVFGFCLFVWQVYEAFA